MSWNITFTNLLSFSLGVELFKSLIVLFCAISSVIIKQAPNVFFCYFPLLINAHTHFNFMLYLCRLNNIGNPGCCFDISLNCFCVIDKTMAISLVFSYPISFSVLAILELGTSDDKTIEIARFKSAFFV